MTQVRILMSPPDVGELEQEYVLRAMKSGWVAPAGPDLAAFEQEVAERCRVPYAVALSSGTAALHLALLSWGVGPGDVVVTSTMTFAATANVIRYTGAEPYFVDCDPVTANMDPDLLDDALTFLGLGGRQGGRGHAGRHARQVLRLPSDREGDRAARRTPARRRLRVLRRRAATDEPAGSIGDAAVLSFNGNKIMTTSGGGMLLTHDEALAERARYLSTQARQPVAHYEHTDIGYNYRLSNILAALGRAQLARLDDMLRSRREWRERYRRIAAQYEGVAVVGGEDDEEDNCWLTAITVDEQVTGVSAR